jgi:drug/metabolite transporter (DMT)-like permease
LLFVNGLLALNFIIASAISILHDTVDRIQEQAQTPYIFCLFLSAGLCSLLIIIVKRQGINLAAVGYGSVLGIFNGMATLFSLLALMELNSVFMFPVASCAIIIGSALLAFLLWGERLLRRQLIGLVGAVIVIVLIHMDAFANV